MGIEATVEEKEDTKNQIVSISSDQLYVGDKNPNHKDDEDKPVAAAPGSPTESAAITMAKMAAKDALSEGGNKKDKDPKKAANLELEYSADPESAQRLAELENNSQETADAGLSRQFALIEDKSQVIEDVGGADKKDDLAVPNWAKYSDPLAQRADIEKELNQVKK